MTRPSKAFQRLFLASVAMGLCFVTHLAGETLFLERGLLDMEPAGDALLAIDSDGELLRSTNNGGTFLTRFTPDAFELPTALAVSGQTAIAVCEGGVVMRSVDGGQTWAEANAPGDFATLNDVATDFGNVWIAVGESTGAAYALRSSDGGANWSKINFSQAGTLESISFDATAKVWMMGGWELKSGRSGFAFRSTDGLSWSEVALPEEVGSVDAIAANGIGLFGLVGADGFYGVVDAGGTFRGSSFETISESLSAIEAQSDGSWIAGGMEGVLLKIALSDENLTGSVLREAKAGSSVVTSFVQISPGTVLVASKDGFGESVYNPHIGIFLADGKLVVTALDVALGKEYYLLVSNDLKTWQPWSAGTVQAAGSSIQWVVSQEFEISIPFFFKLVEN